MYIREILPSHSSQQTLEGGEGVNFASLVFNMYINSDTLVFSPNCYKDHQTYLSTVGLDSNQSSIM